jgi:hypothetical protein
MTSRKESTAEASTLIELVRIPKTTFITISTRDTLIERRAVWNFLFLLISLLLNDNLFFTCRYSFICVDGRSINAMKSDHHSPEECRPR